MVEPVTFYVSLNGNDAWSGKLPEPDKNGTDGPFGTLRAARDAVRELKKDGSLPCPVQVYVKGGKYFLAETLVLDARDSGSVACPVTFAAYPGEQPILSGGCAVKGWKPFHDGILWADLPGTKGGKWKFRQLFLRGRRQPRASFPKPEPGNPHAGWASIEGPAEEGSLQAFLYRPDTFPHRWSKPTEIEVNIIVGFNWINDIIPIKEMDEEKRFIKLERKVFQIDRSPWFWTVPLQPGSRYRCENGLEDLTLPGEWCLDSEDGRLYFYPPTQDSDPDEVIVPKLDRLISLEGASYITLEGLCFTETMDGDDYHCEGYEGYGPAFPRRGLRYGGEAVHLKNAERCVIENCTFDQVGGSAIYLEGFNARNCIRCNEISGAGTYGVAMIGTRDAHPLDNRVENNHIHEIGVFNKYGSGVYMGLSNMNIIAHNEIHHVPFHAVMFGNSGYGRNIVEYNRIHHTAMEISDSGAINCWMEDPGPALRPDVERSGHIIRYNFISDVSGVKVDKEGNVATDAHRLGDLTMGIYMDTCTSNCFIYGNILLRAGRWGIYIQGGKNNIVENNLILDCGCAFGFSDIVADWFAPHMKNFMVGNRFVGNIFVSHLPSACLGTLHDWREWMVAGCDHNLYALPGGGKLVVLKNINALEKAIDLENGENIYRLDQWQAIGFDAHSTFEDPGEIDFSKAELAFPQGSAAGATGFMPIPLGKIGIIR